MVRVRKRHHQKERLTGIFLDELLTLLQEHRGVDLLADAESLLEAETLSDHLHLKIVLKT